MGILQRWSEYRRQYGFAGLVRHLGARAVRPVWEQASAQILVLQPPIPTREARVPVKIGILGPSEARASAFEHPDWAERWSRGDRCFGAWVGDRCVHHSWVSTRDSLIGEVHGHIRVGPGEAYIYDCYTDGSCRGQGIFPAVLSHIGQTLASQGILRIWIAVEEENRSSLTAIQRAGFALAGEVAYKRLGPKGALSLKHEPGLPPFQIG